MSGDQRALSGLACVEGDDGRCQRCGQQVDGLEALPVCPRAMHVPAVADRVQEYLAWQGELERRERGLLPRRD